MASQQDQGADGGERNRQRHAADAPALRAIPGDTHRIEDRHGATLRRKAPSGKIATVPAAGFLGLNAMTVVPFRRVRARTRLGPPVEPPPALAGKVPAPDSPEVADAAEERRRTHQNLAAL